MPIPDRFRDQCRLLRMATLFVFFGLALPVQGFTGRGYYVGAFKALRNLRPDYPLWRDFPYEYETRLAIDVINGSPLLREWVDDAAAVPADLDALAARDEREWREERANYLLYA